MEVLDREIVVVEVGLEGFIKLDVVFNNEGMLYCVIVFEWL